MMGQPLQQHARGALCVRVQPEARRQLLGILEINAQRVGEALAADRHDALIALRTAIGLERDGEITLAHELAHVARLLVPGAVAGETAQPQATRTLREQKMHGSLALELEREHTIELDGGGEQERSGHRLAEQSADRGGVLAMLDQRAPGGIEMDQMPADRIVLEHEAMQAVSIMHQLPPPNLALRSSLSCAGFALPEVAFITCPTKKPNSLSLPAR